MTYNVEHNRPNNLRVDLTGSTPESASTTLAGSSHNLNLKTSYYTATIPIWLDLIASPSDWASSFLSDEAQEVLAVLGGLILVFAMPSGTTESNTTEHDQTRNLIRQVGQVVQKGLGGWEWDGVRLAVGMGDGESDEWDEICAELGLEFVQLGSGHSQERNEFGGTFTQDSHPDHNLCALCSVFCPLHKQSDQSCLAEKGRKKVSNPSSRKNGHSKSQRSD